MVINARGQEDLDAAVRELEGAGYEALGVAGDVFDETTPQRLVDGAVERFGKVTHLVPNVGILHHYGPLLTIKRHRFVEHRHREHVVRGGADPAGHAGRHGRGARGRSA